MGNPYYVRGASVVLDGAICRLLDLKILDGYRSKHRGEHPDIDRALQAIHSAAITWANEINSPAASPTQSRATSLTTSQVAAQLHVGQRAVRQAISRGHLDAELIDGRWLISREALARFQNDRDA